MGLDTVAPRRVEERAGSLPVEGVKSDLVHRFRVLTMVLSTIVLPKL